MREKVVIRIPGADLASLIPVVLDARIGQQGLIPGALIVRGEYVEPDDVNLNIELGVLL